MDLMVNLNATLPSAKAAATGPEFVFGKARWMVLLAAAGLACLVASCDRAPEGERIETLRGQSMGTEWSMVLVEPDALTRIRAEVQLLLRNHEQRYSTWIHSSELSRLNRTPAQTAFAASPQLMRSLYRSGLMLDATQGAFDPTCAPLVRAWGFGPGAGPVAGFDAPDEARIDHLRRHSTWDNLDINSHAGTITRLHEAVEIDLSALAKGEGVDLLADWLVEQGQRSFLIEIGGDLRAGGGAPGRQSWPVGIEHPDGSGEMLAAVALRNQALATSGTYIQQLPAGGNGEVRPSHIIDPRTGYPVGHETISVSVVADTCAEADAWATALLVIGAEDGLALASSHNLPAMFVLRDQLESQRYLVLATPMFETLTDL